MTFERYQAVAYSEWFRLIRATFATASPKPIVEEFLVFKIFSALVS